MSATRPGRLALTAPEPVRPVLDRWSDSTTPTLVLLDGLEAAGCRSGKPPSVHEPGGQQVLSVSDPLKMHAYLQCLAGLSVLCPEPGCTDRFRIFQGKLMRKHLETYHGKALSEPREMFPCQKCDKKFKTYEIMQKHLKGVHESMHVPCYICAKLVKEGTPMEHHIKYVHLRPNQFE